MYLAFPTLLLILTVVAPTVLCGQTSPGSAAAGFLGMPNGDAATGDLSPLTLQQSYPISKRTKVLAAMVGWFGTPKHADVGYKSDDRGEVARQLKAMQARGIDGVTIAWYGDRDTGVSGKTAALIMKQAEQMPGFFFALRVNDGMLKWYAKGQDPTAVVTEQLQAARSYFQSPAYLNIHGRPVIFFFGFESFGVDWKKVKAALPDKPLFLFRNSKGFDTPGSDGAFAWGPASPPSYLSYFYKIAAAHPAQIAVGDLHKGFNDSMASWTQHRVIDQQCGDTFLNTVRALPDNLPFVQLVTWDDYEEGTELETGVDNCVRVSLSQAKDGLHWNVTGNESAVDHYEVQSSGDKSPQNSKYTTIARVKAGQHSYAGSLQGSVRVVAVGKALFLNQDSNTLPINPRPEAIR